MSGPSPPKHRKDFHVAIICPLQLEADAAEAFFDRFWDEDGDRYGKVPGDQNAYRTGAIGTHNVVLAYMPDIGKGHAASVAASFRSSFQGIRVALIVGICGGVPGRTERGVYLGDIIISDEIVTYDFGRRLPGVFRRKETATGSVANHEVRAFLHKLKSRKGREHLFYKTRCHLEAVQNRTGDYGRPPLRMDRLFDPTYHHKHHGASRCRKCKNGEHCRKAHETTCEMLGCDWKRLVPRFRSPYKGFNIHFGRIASGDTVMKSGVDRDRIAEEENIIAFEMEGAGICNNLPCLVVKGVCDYADSHKDKQWQEHAAGAAAACMKSLLEQWATVDQPERTFEQNKDPSQESPCSPSAFSDVTPLQATHTDRPYHSENNQDVSNSALLQVLPTIESNFKNALTCFKMYKKHLPRDCDLKRTLRAQRAVFLSNVEVLPLADSDYVKDHLSSSRKDCLDIAIAIRTKLDEIEDVTKRLPAATKAKVQLEGATDTLKYAVEDLQSLVQVFASLIPQREQFQRSTESKVVKTPKSRREFQHFRIVQKAAYSLYDAFTMACKTHAVHDVHLSLQPHLSGTFTSVRFNVAFIQNPMTGKTVWINVETTVKPSETSLQHVSTSLASGLSSLKRTKPDEEVHCVPRSRKRVQFQPLPEPVPSVCPAEPIASIPNLYLQRNFCTVVERSISRRECHGCIGLLGDNDSCKHLAYMDSQNTEAIIPASLSQLISLSGADSTKGMGLYERVRLARYLATAVLYYHATPWLKSPWRSDDVHFFADYDSLLKQAQHALPYITTSIHASDSSTQPQRQSADYYHVIRNPVLFGLGVMLLELAYQAPLRSLQEPVDLQKGETQGFADYFTAHRLVNNSYRVVSRSFQMIV